MIVGYKELSELLKNRGEDRVRMPSGVTTFALAKCCYEWWCKERGVESFRIGSMSWLDAMADFVAFLRDVFVGAEELFDNPLSPFQPESPGYYLHRRLMRSERFSMAWRKYWDFVLRGEAGVFTRRGSTHAKQTELFPDEAL